MPELPDTETDPAARAEALGHVESLPLGEAVILHNRESGAIVASNAFGALLLDHLRATPETDTVVGRVAAALDRPVAEVRGAVQGTLASWAADGLFLTALRPFPMPIPYRPPDGGATRGLGLGGRGLVLEAEDPALVDDIDRALAPIGLRETDPGDGAVRLEVILDDTGYGVFRDRQPVWGAAGYELTRFHLLREIMDILCRSERVAAHLHASAMAMHGTGLIFAGASGSGKSTLATLLLGAGAALAADDHVAIDITGAALLAFPTRPNLKPGTSTLPRVRAVIAAEAEGAGDFVPRARVPVGTAVRLGGFVFPRYDPEGENALTPMAPDAALRELIQTGSRVSRSTRSIAPLLHALGTTPCQRLSYHDTGFAIAECRALFES